MPASRTDHAVLLAGGEDFPLRQAFKLPETWYTFCRCFGGVPEWPKGLPC